MILKSEALKIAEKEFPEGPEKIVELLNIKTVYSPLVGCDGWCLSKDDRAIIRINSGLLRSRKRFTLAHELGHLILGIPAIIGETYEDMLRSDSEEEKKVNDFASELLVPRNIVKSLIPSLPVVGASIKTLARKAKISTLAAAIRVCNLAEEVGLKNALVVHFEEGIYKWQWSKNLKMPVELALKMLRRVKKSSDKTVRFLTKDDDADVVVVASLIENSQLGADILFIQKLPKSLGLGLSKAEQRMDLESKIFKGNVAFRHKVSGYFGAHKNRCMKEKMSLQKAVDFFWDRYESVFLEAEADLEIAKKYINLRIGEWY